MASWNSPVSHSRPSLASTVSRLIKLLRRETRNEAQLSLTERATLGMLYPENRLAPTDIARAEKVTTQSMSQVINHLAELKYIDRTPSEEDKRKVNLSLTDAGRNYVEQLRKDKQEWLTAVLQQKTTPEEKATIAAATARGQSERGSPRAANASLRMAIISGSAAPSDTRVQAANTSS